jgi:hypothetical protein
MELKSIYEGILNILEEIKERLEAIKINPPIPVTPISQDLNDMISNQVIRVYLSWIDISILINMISFDLDIVYFIKLIPRKE